MARSKSKQGALKLVEPGREPAAKAQPKVSPTPSRTARAAKPKTQTLEPAEPLEALVDGKRVVIDAQDEVVIRCGKASITLRRNGRVVIRGTYVETRAEGVNRIKGGSVQIN